MKRHLYLLPCLLFLLYLTWILAQEPEQPKQWHFLIEEQKIQQLQWELSKEFQPKNIAITNVNLIKMTDQSVIPESAVLVSSGRITAIGKSSAVNIPKNYQVIDGSGLFLMPGLTDMHVHNLVSSSQHLLNLANGITTVRDMDGFPWMLKMRDQIASNRLLGPNMYITGHILNAAPMGMYATVVKSEEQGRQLVREQKAAGYDFIKVHNNMPELRYAAILKEAREQKIDVVGHIPHDMTVKKAIDYGQRTLEHFKGYILDSTLTLTDENYVDATRNAEVWNCPTFYNYRGFVRDEEARKLVLESTEMKYASWRDKQDWLELAEKKDEHGLSVQQNVLPLSQKIFKDLMPIGAKFISGTDSGGGYPFMVPGFSLQRELELFQEAGMTPYETLKSSTVNAAEAMGRQNEFGTIEVGKRADLILLRSNPFKDVKNAMTIAGVGVRGIWLSRSALDRILQRIEAIYNPPVAERTFRQPSQQEIAQYVKSHEKLRSEGFIFRSHDLELLEELR